MVARFWHHCHWQAKKNLLGVAHRDEEAERRHRIALASSRHVSLVQRCILAVPHSELERLQGLSLREGNAETMVDILSILRSGALSTYDVKSVRVALHYTVRQQDSSETTHHTANGQGCNYIEAGEVAQKQLWRAQSRARRNTRTGPCLYGLSTQTRVQGRCAREKSYSRLAKKHPCLVRIGTTHTLYSHDCLFDLSRLKAMLESHQAESAHKVNIINRRDVVVLIQHMVESMKYTENA